MARDLLKWLVLPPGACIVLAAFGLLLSRRLRRTGRAVALAALASFLLLATPWMGDRLLRSLQTHPALPRDVEPGAARAIVVLSADCDVSGFEYDGPTLGAMSLVRVRYAADLARRTGLPVLTSGGAAAPGLPSLAAMMAEALEREFGVAARWREAASTNTRENALFSRDVLARDGIAEVFLVTHAWHMPRALAEFERAGLRVIPAPTGFHWAGTGDLLELLPSAKGLRSSTLALHERFGRLAAALRPD